MKKIEIKDLFLYVEEGDVLNSSDTKVFTKKEILSDDFPGNFEDGLDYALYEIKVIGMADRIEKKTITLKKKSLN